MDITVKNLRGKGFEFRILRNYIKDHPGAAVLSDIVCSLRNERGRRVAVLDRHLPDNRNNAPASMRIIYRHIGPKRSRRAILAQAQAEHCLQPPRPALSAKHRHICSARCSRNLFLVTRLPPSVFEAREMG